MAQIACYCRVSTRHQKNDSQRAEIERWLHYHGLDPLVVRWFEDKESGTTTQRLAFDQLQKAIFAGIVKSGAVGRMMASVMFGLAEIEVDYRRERQAAGIKVGFIPTKVRNAT
jgi:DNA invertase Pin-like site-specific DNA recombinase